MGGFNVYRRQALTLLFLSLLPVLLLSASAASAQGFNKPVRVIVPFAPGGASDILARLIGPKLQELISQPVVVENKPGAGGNIGAEIVAKADKDGHTLLLMDVSPLAISPTLVPGLSYNPAKELAPIGMISFAPYVISINPSVPAKTVAEFIAFGKANAGKVLFANPGIGLANHLTNIQVARAWGLEVKHVPYKGGSEAMKSVASGETHLTINSIPTTAAFLSGGQVRAIALSGDQRHEQFTELPSFKELKLEPIDSGSWQGLLTTAGAPPALVTRLNADLAKILAMPDILKRLGDLGAQVKAGPSSELASWLERNTATFATVIKDNGIKLQ
jgi:tripartite-type tricarboxylate transporter receptor subunit TctC